MACMNCHREMTIAARGLCRACYSRWQKRGSTDYAPKRERTFCQIDGCGGPVVSHGLCDMHRLRLQRHGSLESQRPDSWGAKHKHPLFNTWAWMRRHRGTHGIDPLWETDFLQFSTDIGERPSNKHKLFAADDSRPIGPSNWVWKISITQKVPGEDHRTHQNRIGRVYRAVRQEAFKGYGLKKNFGLTYEEYAAMSEEQDNTCAICGEAEGAVIRGKKISLAVDHCHKLGHIRGLLCRSCNNGLGMFKDDVTLLQKAIKYLE